MRKDNRYGGGRKRSGGGGGGGGGRGGRGPKRGGGGGGGRRHTSGGGGGGQRNRSRRGGGRRPQPSGNQRERIQVESGYLVLIDQFMLANPQFLEQVERTVDQEPEMKDALVRAYGGTVVELEPSTYRIERDPFAYTIVIHQDGEAPRSDNLAEQANDNLGHVFVDTRCLAMIDRELLDDSALLDKYRQLWFSGQDKACRDLLRDNGGAVRYGFQRYGDELGVYAIPGESVIALWPDVSEEVEAAESGSTEEAPAA